MAAVDVDSTDPELVDAYVAWCRHNLGTGCERVGNAPKILLVYRSAEPWRKSASAWLLNGSDVIRHRVEILGAGQQFVAYAIHPDTHQPYRWTDPRGGLDHVPADALPVITAAQAAEALHVFEAMAAARGYTRKAQTLAPPASAIDAGAEPPLGLSIPQLRDLLDFATGADDYDTWIKTGLAIHAETGGDIDGLTLWNEWSSKAPNYVGYEDCEKRWSSFDRESRRITGRWLRARVADHKRQLNRQEKALDLESIIGRITSTKHADELLNEIAADAGIVARRDLSLQIQIEAAIRSRFEALTNTKITAAQVRSAMRTPARTDSIETLAPAAPSKTQHPFNQAGNADRLLDRYGRNLMYALGLGWYRWGGATWVKSDPLEIEHLAYETVRALPEEFATIENAEKAKEAARFALASQSTSMVEAMAKLATLSKGVTCRADALDRNRNLIGCKNGTLDLQTGLLLPADRAHRITMTTHLDYDPEARSELWEQTVFDTLSGDAGLTSFLQRLMGYALLGMADEDVLAIPYGSGCNGKSTIFNLLRIALGDYGRMASAATFTQSSGTGTATGGTAREDLLRLRNARFVYVTEPNEDSILREDVVKAMTGGEPIPARGLYERASVEIQPTWLCIIPTNHRPLIVGDDYGIWRRLLPIPFTVNFDSDLRYVKDPQREEKLLDHLPAILAWCVRGALDYQLHGFHKPAVVDTAIDSYKTDMDLLSEWIVDCCELGPQCRATKAQLWASWRIWAEPRGELRLIPSSRKLARRIAVRYQAISANEFIGIAIKNLGEI